MRAERNAKPIKAAMKANSMVSARLSLLIMPALLRAAITGESGHRDPVAGVSLAHGVEPPFELIDDRHELRQVPVGHEAEDDDRVLVLGDEAPHEKERKLIDILAERADAGQPHLLSQPAPQRFERPHVADARLALQRLSGRRRSSPASAAYRGPSPAGM